MVSWWLCYPGGCLERWLLREVIVETDAIAEELGRRDSYGEFKYMISLTSVGESISRPIQQVTLKLGLVFRVDAGPLPKADSHFPRPARFQTKSRKSAQPRLKMLKIALCSPCVRNRTSQRIRRQKPWSGPRCLGCPTVNTRPNQTARSAPPRRSSRLCSDSQTCSLTNQRCRLQPHSPARRVIMTPVCLGLTPLYLLPK